MEGGRGAGGGCAGLGREWGGSEEVEVDDGLELGIWFVVGLGLGLGFGVDEDGVARDDRGCGAGVGCDCGGWVGASGGCEAEAVTATAVGGVCCSI